MFYVPIAVYLSLEWMISLKVSSLPMVIKSYQCTPNTSNFIISNDGDLVTKGLLQNDSGTYKCISADFTGSRVIELIVRGEENKLNAKYMHV